MKIRCDNGLCDRLRVIFSYLKKAQKNNEDLIICWIINEKCNGHFLNLFKPIHRVTFTTNTENCDFFGWQPCSDFDPNLSFIYKDLLLLDNLQEKINEIKSKMEINYASIHIRRTDKVTYNGLEKLTSDSDFFTFIESHKQKIFLATDNYDTQKEYKKKYKEKIICSSEITSTNEFRKTSLQIATIDLFTCINSKYFLGTNISGFSKIIEQYHAHAKKRRELLL